MIIEAGRMGTSRSLHADAVTPYDCIRFNRYGQAHNFCLARAVSLSPARTCSIEVKKKDKGQGKKLLWGKDKKRIMSVGQKVALAKLTLGTTYALLLT